MSKTQTGQRLTMFRKVGGLSQEKIAVNFETLTKYDRDLKCLLKKHHTLNQDIVGVKKVPAVRPDARSPFSFLIEGSGTETCTIGVMKIANKQLNYIYI